MLDKNQDFIPSFCPNAECRFHHEHELDKKWYIRYSSYSRKGEEKRHQRFMCLGCKRTFSGRTFASEYCLKLELEYSRLFAALEQGIDLSKKSGFRGRIGALGMGRSIGAQ